MYSMCHGLFKGAPFMARSMNRAAVPVFKDKVRPSAAGPMH